MTEVGPDLSAFPDERRFVSWLRLCPRTAISGGKPLKGKRRGPGPAVSLQRSRTALGAAFRNLSRRKGYAVAVFAMARKLAVLVYRMLRWGRDYVDIGADAYEAPSRCNRLSGIKAAARFLGYELVEQDPSNPPHRTPSTA